MAKATTRYLCEHCDYVSPVHLGRCPTCGEWNTFVQQTVQTGKMAESAANFGAVALGLGPTVAVPLNAVDSEMLLSRTPSGITELDRVLGGGLIPGSYILLGGDPGIGKSTLMLQAASAFGKNGLKILYVAGEESPTQIKLRADRLQLDAQEAIQLVPETNLHEIIQHIQTAKPDLVVIDSIQAIYQPGIQSPAGSVGQIKACASQLMTVAKTQGVSILLIGHVTKDGQVSGPKLLEHTVDAVLYFEGEKYNDLRILRAVKNRFGSTQEMGVFQMVSLGLRPVDNPSELFLSGIGHQPEPGSAIVCTVEGTRPVLVEIQALSGVSSYATPRRVTNGFEYNRLHQLIAVLERRVGLDFSHQDLFVNVVGGLDIEEPAADLAVAMALVSSERNIPVISKTVIAGEVGLLGEIRPVRRWEDRVAEARKIGFERIILPTSARSIESNEVDLIEGIEVIPVTHITEAIQACFQPVSTRLPTTLTSSIG